MNDYIVNILLLPTTITTLSYFVYNSKSRVIYEQLTSIEKIKYISIYGAKLSIITSIILLPLFLQLNDKILMTYKYNY